MPNDGLDGNVSRNGFLKNVLDERFSNSQIWLGNLGNFAQMLLQYEIPSGNCYILCS